MGGTPDQVENAAEIGIEYNLGLTHRWGWCKFPDAVGSVKAITAVSTLVPGDGEQFVPLDKAIKTMRDRAPHMK